VSEQTTPPDAAPETSTSGTTDGTTDDANAPEAPTPRVRHHRRLTAHTAGLFLAALAMVIACGVGYLKYLDSSENAVNEARRQSVQTATDCTVALLSYAPDDAQQTLTAAAERLTGTFKDSYLALVNDVVAPGSTQKRITATATVPAAAAVSTSKSHAVVMVFVDQTITPGEGSPSDSTSVVQVTLEKAGDRWLVSGFDPK
jgi:Mce-associated membrane protein